MIRRLAMIGVFAAAGSCGDSPTAGGSGCPGVAGFGSYGCTRLVVHVGAPPQPHPNNYALDVIVRDPQAGSSGGAMASGSPGGFTAPAPITVFFPDIVPGDTLRTWIVARMIDLTMPAPGGQLPIAAADSVRFLLRVSHNGTLPVPDTLTLTLKKP